MIKLIFDIVENIRCSDKLNFFGIRAIYSAKPRGQVNFDSSVPHFFVGAPYRFVPCAEGLPFQEASPRLRLAAIAWAEESLEL